MLRAIFLPYPPRALEPSNVSALRDGLRHVAYELLACITRNFYIPPTHSSQMYEVRALEIESAPDASIPKWK